MSPPPEPRRPPSAGALRRAAAAVAAAALLAAGCGPGTGAPPADPRPGAVAPGAARRLVSLSPNVTEIFVALGLADRLVGVDDASRLPAGRSAVRLGGFYSPDLELLVELHPDLVVLLAGQAGTADRLRALGIPVLAVRNQSLADVEASVRAVARRAGAPAAGDALAARLRRDLAPRPVAHGRRVVLAVSSRPGALGQVLVAGPQSFHGELLSRLGGVNAFPDLPSAYATVAVEEVLARHPGEVVELQGEPLDDATRRALAAAWRRLAGPDVEIEVLDGADVLIPGPHLPRLYRRLAEALS